jgi:hypothetical protein
MSTIGSRTLVKYEINENEGRLSVMEEVAFKGQVVAKQPKLLDCCANKNARWCGRKGTGDGGGEAAAPC